MAQITVDTNNDTLEELEHAAVLIQKAIARRQGTVETPVKKTKMDVPQAVLKDDVAEETAIDTPFLKITVKSEEERRDVPTLNQLLNDEQLTEDELKKLYKEVIPQTEKSESEHKPRDGEKGKKQDAFIEIIEYEEEKS